MSFCPVSPFLSALSLRLMAVALSGALRNTSCVVAILSSEQFLLTNRKHSKSYH